MIVDSLLCNPSLREKELELGFDDARTREIVCLKTKADLGKARAGCSVESSDLALLEQAVKKKEGLLVNPFLLRNFGKEKGLVTLVKDGGHCFELPLKEFLEKRFVLKARLFRQVTRLLENCLKKRARFVFSSRAENGFGLKSPREIIALGQCLGLTREQAKKALEGF